MKLTKKFSAVLLSFIFMFSFFIPVFAAESQEGSETVSVFANSKKFTTERAIDTALTAAKAKFTIEGIDGNASKEATVTKIKYDKKSGSYAVTVRAQNIYKYTCTITVKNFLGSELGLPENSDYIEQGKISGLFGQLGEKISYFFIRLFKQDGPKE